MDHLKLDMPHAARDQAFKVSNGSGHFRKVIPLWASTIYNGFSIHESPHMEYVYSSTIWSMYILLPIHLLTLH